MATSSKPKSSTRRRNNKNRGKGRMVYNIATINPLQKTNKTTIIILLLAIDVFRVLYNVSVCNIAL
jgi:hypothetical protein